MSDIHLTSVPFGYHITVFPSAKSRTPQSAIVREYTLVRIPEVPPDEMRPAIRHEGYELPSYESRQTAVVYAWNKLLYRPATDRVTGEPLDLEAFELAVSSYVAHYLVHGFNKPPSRLDANQFPTACDGSGVHAGNPLAHRLLDEIVVEDWKPTWRTVTSERDREERLAQVLLSQGLVTVDGQVFVACPEPVWSVDPYGANAIRVRLELYPCGAGAAQCFRLDRLDEARDWARRRGGSDAAPPSIEILNGSILRRDDEWALAACLVSCTHLRGPLDDLDDENMEEGDPAELVGRMVQAIRKKRRGPREEEVVALLDGLCSSMDAAGDWPLTAHDVTNERLAHIRERWTLAKEAGRGPAGRQPFDADDLAVLAEISRELGWTGAQDPIP